LNATFEPGLQVTGKVVKAEVFGVFVWLGPGRVGMVPRVWSGSGDGAGFESRFLPGTDIAVEVVDVSDGGKRVRLSVVGVDREAAEAARAEAMRPRPSTPAEHRPQTDHRASGDRRPANDRRPQGDRRPPADRPRRRDDAPHQVQTPDPGTGFGSQMGEALRAALKRDDQ
jgi:predicted RNA-binding protein with RPS1 domain